MLALVDEKEYGALLTKALRAIRDVLDTQSANKDIEESGILGGPKPQVLDSAYMNYMDSIKKASPDKGSNRGN